jgi:PII-like signaling protein
MNDVTALRLYFPQTARAKPTKFWHRLSAPTLGHRLLTAARQNGIQQALMHTVHAGYLPGQKLSHLHVESAPAQHALCIEMIDTEERLRHFVHVHADELHHVRAVLLRGEIPI